MRTVHGPAQSLLIFRSWALGLVLALGVLTAASGQARPPVEAYFSPARLQAAQLSPSGRWLGALTSMPGRRVGLLVVDLQGGGSKFLEVSPTEDMAWFEWVSDDWLVLGINEPGDLTNHQRQWSGLMAAHRDGSKLRPLIRRKWAPSDPLLRRKVLDPIYEPIGRGAPGTNEYIVGENQFDANGEYSHTLPMALDVSDTSLRSLAPGAPRATRWIFDTLGRPRVAINSLGKETVVHWASTEGREWKEISRTPSFERPFTVAYVDGPDSMVVHTAAGNGGMALRRFNLATGKPDTEAILVTEGFDPDATPIRDRTTGRVQGVHLLLDGMTTVWFGEDMKRLQALVDAKLPGRVNLISCRPCVNPELLLVNSYADNFPGETLVYRVRKDQWERVGVARPALDGVPAGTLDLHRTPARDGLSLPVWVTLPANADGKPRPAVVLVHGGPHVRGTEWQWDADAQFLASRGYVVIEPEFRGSEGYGSAHERAGYKQWGLAMQDDISDALKFAVGKGWADPRRVCIMGASYGGYAALMGVAKNPDEYRCAVAAMAVADPRFMFDMHWSDISANARDNRLPITLGDRKADEARFIATSPIEQVARIKAPVLLLHGALDRRVPIQSGERMRDALQRNGKAVEWVVYPDEAHGFHRPENRIDYWQRVEVFLARHLQ